MTDTAQNTLLLEREYGIANSECSLVLRITRPVQARSEGGLETWICYLQISGGDCSDCVPITASSEFDAILGAAQLAHYRLAPVERDLIYEGRIGGSHLPRIVTVLASEAALAEIDRIIDREPPRQFKRIGKPMDP